VLDETRLVEAVPPGRVLERALADRRPEPGDDIPLRLLAGDRAARDLAHVQRLGPVLDGEMAAGGGVVRERDVAGGEHALGRGAHPLVHDDPAVADLEPGAFGEPGARAHLAGHQDQLGLERIAPGDVDGVLADLRHARAEQQLDPELLQPALDPAAGLVAEAPLARNRLVADQRHLHPAQRERCCGLAADEGGADDDRRLGPLGVIAQHPRRREAAQHQDRFVGRPRDAQRRRLGAGGDHAGVVGKGLAGAEHDRARGGIERPGLAAEAHFHALALVPVRGLDRQLGVLELPAQEVLRERWALVGEGQLRRDELDGTRPARLPVSARRGERGGAATDDHDSFAHGSQVPRRAGSGAPIPPRAAPAYYPDRRTSPEAGVFPAASANHPPTGVRDICITGERSS
jgi:hypothetical protein